MPEQGIRQTRDFSGVLVARPAMVQPKLAVGSVDDPLEHEADSIADQVMRMPAPPAVQRKCAECDEEADEEIRLKSAGPATASADSAVAELGSGTPLPAGERQFFEQRLGRDFSGVRVHSESQAARMLGARAFTLGRDVAFAPGEWRPGTYDGRKLLAHELVHVVQQGARPLDGAIRRSVPAVRGTADPAIVRRSVAGCRELLNNPGPPVPAALGTLIHKTIQDFFMLKVPGATRVSIPGATANPQRTGGRSTIPPQQIGNPNPRAGKGSPDLACLNGGVLQVAEIKPANFDQLIEGEIQVTRYIEQGNAEDEPQQIWRQSRNITRVTPMLEQTFQPPSLSFIQPDVIIEVIFSWCQSGVLAYVLRGRRRPDDKRQRQPARVPERAGESRKDSQQSRPGVPEGLGSPGPVGTPDVKPPEEDEGGKVIPFPGKPKPKPGEEGQPEQHPVPVAARSAGERILDFIAEIIVSGRNIDEAVTQFLRANPEVVRNIEAAVAAIVAGAIISDILSGGAAIAKDPAVAAILAAMLRIAQTIPAMR